MSEDEDPFENLDPPEDREGDPFERLGDAGPPDDDTQSEDTDSGDPLDGGGDGERSDDPAASEEPVDSEGDDEPAFEEEFIEADDAVPIGEPPAEGDQTTGEDDPFADMDSRDGDPFDGAESVFETVDVEGVDPDEVWESLESEGSNSDTPSLDESRYTDVSKHRFCEQCEFFSSPPNAHCTHEEAEIIEHLDMETVRLLNCPVVAEQREIENEE